jgi:NADPH:quinone reductase-like Zn-dependent oxidoreductase
MKAIYCKGYGSLEDLRVTDVETPKPGPDEVLVRVAASSVNFNTIAHVTGKPVLARMMGLGVRRPKHPIPGNDVAGTVEAVGRDVTRFSEGDEVYADVSEYGWGAFAQYVCTPESALTQKPAGITFEEAAAVPEAGLVALQALRDAGNLQKTEKILICGASGGIGTFAVQIAKALGAEVTAVCSTRNSEFVRSIGADHILDYRKEDVLKNNRHYDLILATAGYRPLSEYVSALEPRGRCVVTGGEMKQIFQAMLLGPLYSRRRGMRVTSFLVKPNKDLLYMNELLNSRIVKSVLDRSYPLHQAKEALQYYATGKARGKVVITMEEQDR